MTPYVGKQTEHGIRLGLGFQMKDQLRGWNYAEK